MRLRWLPLVMLGCSSEPEPIDYTVDIRVDRADPARDPDSFGTQMCVTADGTVYVMWLDDREDIGSEEYDIYLNRSVNRGGEGEAPTDDAWLPAAVKVNQGDGRVFDPNLYCNETGVYVVWEDDRDGLLKNHQIYFNKSDDKGETFLAEDILLEIDPDGMSMSLGPKITGDGKDLYVTWYDNLNGAYDILMSSSGDGGESWRDPVRVDSDQPGSAYSARPEIAISDNTQDIWITWEDSRDGKADIYFARSDSGGTTFKDDDRLDGGDDKGSADSFEPELCTDGQANVYVVWHDARSGQFRDVFMNYSANKGANWLTNAVRLDNDAPGFANSLFPKCLADGTEAHVIWQDNRAGNYDVFYRNLKDGIPGDELRADLGTPEGFSNSLEAQIARTDDKLIVAWEDGRADAGEDGYDDLYYNLADIFSPDDWRGEDDGDLRIDSMYDGQSYKVDLQIAVLGGQIYAAWTDGRNGNSDIFFQRLTIGEAAKPPPLEEGGQ
ncbi:MAG: hypothetical protein H6735_25930 [Alphaproteobacteria bacterium]|nr:hypothetical protein [Alphaproteobacteria bacterium]